MSEDNSQIRCLILPLESGALVVPNAVVAEVLQNQILNEPLESAPGWLSGTVAWQDQPELPVVSFESLCGQLGARVEGETTVVVMHGLGSQPRARHYGVRIADVPSFEFVDSTNLVAADDQSSNCDYVASRVFIKGVQASVPDFDEIEQLLSSS